MNIKNQKAYLLLSGGQDSFVCLLWGLENFIEVEAVSILYGQSHKIELQYAQSIASHFDISHQIYDIGDFLKNTANSTLLQNGDHNTHHGEATHLPASFVPNRNGLFLTIISNHAFKNGEPHIDIITGTCETDYSGYPDCRDAYIKAKSVELSLGLDKPVTIHTPLMWKDKAQTFEMAYKYGKLKELNSMTLSCYNGYESMNEWGRGCGVCPACKLRENGYQQFVEKYYKG